MPSFDVVSEFDAHEATNAVDQANREVSNRFDFKGTGSKFELEDSVISLTSQSDFQLQQMLDILRQKLSKRGIDIGCLKEEEPEITGTEARQKVIMRQGIDTPLAKDLVKKIKAQQDSRYRRRYRARSCGQRQEARRPAIGHCACSRTQTPASRCSTRTSATEKRPPASCARNSADRTLPSKRRTSRCATTCASWARWSATCCATRAVPSCSNWSRTHGCARSGAARTTSCPARSSRSSSATSTCHSRWR